MKVLITGGAGYVGSRLVGSLTSSGAYDVTVVDRLDRGGDSLLPHMDSGRLKVLPVDICDYRSKEQFDVLFHLAALVGEPICAFQPAEAQRVNSDGTRSLLDHIRTKRFVMFSTCSNYGALNGEMAYENTPLTPTGIYSRTKTEAEALVLQAQGTVLRLGTVCGLSARMRYDVLVNEMAYQAARSSAVVVVNKEAWRPMLHMRDMLRASHALLHITNYTGVANPLNAAINIVSENIQKKGLAQEIAKVFPTAAFSYHTTDTGDPRNYQASGAKATKLLGFNPVSTVADALKELALALQLHYDPASRLHFNTPQERT